MSPDELAGRLEGLHPESFGWALSCCGGDRPRAEDVLQTAYVRVLSGRAQFAGRSLFRTWLFGVIRRVALEELRRTRTHDARTVVLEHPAARALADPRTRPDAIDGSRMLHDKLALLPDRQRALLHLVFYQDLTIAEAAEVLEISVGSARTHYERGKARLRSLLEVNTDDRPAAGR